jgi:hypothetical protein
MIISAERPIFVVGAMRSGTTLLRYMLCSHPRIYIPPESTFIPRFFQGRSRAPMKRQQAIDTLNAILSYRPFFKDWQGKRPDPATFVDGLPDLTPATFLDALYRQYACQFGAERWGDKTPIYTSYMDLIAEIFPTAQFIHIIRDGRDVALSMMKAYQTARFFYMDIYYAARIWKQHIRKARASAARLGADRYYELRYEQLAANPEALLREICDFLGEAYVPAMVEPHREAREHYHSQGIHAATQQPVTTKSSGRWRREMSKADQQLFQAGAGDLLDELGYGMVGLGKISLTEKARYAGLRTKYTVVETSRRALQAAGVSHPTSLLSLFRAYPKTS